jgi:hypothetical protein
MHVPGDPALQLSSNLTMIFFIKLHMSLRNFVAIGFNIKEIIFLVLAVPAAPQPWCS